MEFVGSLRTAFEHCHDAVVVMIAAVDEPLDGPIVYANRASTGQTGCALEQLLGQPARLFLGGEAALPSDDSEPRLHLALRIRCKSRSDGDADGGTFRSETAQ